MTKFTACHFSLYYTTRVLMSAEKKSSVKQNEQEKIENEKFLFFPAMYSFFFRKRIH